jgi:hypothetical protein
MAYLCTETTVYRYIENLDAPKKWFKANVDSILKVYGAKHAIQKEDLYFGQLFIYFFSFRGGIDVFGVG